MAAGAKHKITATTVIEFAVKKINEIFDRNEKKMLKGERAVVKRHQDNLKLEGSFEGRQTTAAVVRGERADIVSHQDNLKIEGTFEGRLKAEAMTGQRAKAVKHSDNLKMEGAHQMQRETNAVMVGERAAVVKHRDNLKMEGSFAGAKSESASTHQPTKDPGFSPSSQYTSHDWP